MNLGLYQNLSSWYFHLQGQISFHILSFLDREELKPAGPQAWVEEAFGVDVDLVLQVLELQVQVKSDALLEIYWRKTPLNKYWKSYHVNLVHWRYFEGGAIFYWGRSQVNILFALQNGLESRLNYLSPEVLRISNTWGNYFCEGTHLLLETWQFDG